MEINVPQPVKVHILKRSHTADHATRTAVDSAAALTVVFRLVDRRMERLEAVEADASGEFEILDRAIEAVADGDVVALQIDHNSVPCNVKLAIVTSAGDQQFVASDAFELAVGKGDASSIGPPTSKKTIQAS